jgi:hypothetical protein
MDEDSLNFLRIHHLGIELLQGKCQRNQKSREMKSFCGWFQTQKKLKNFMRIGSLQSTTSIINAFNVMHCSSKNKQSFFSQDDDAFSIVIVDETRG